MGRIGQVAWNKGKVGLCPGCRVRPKGASGKCRECQTIYMREYRKQNPGVMRRLQRAFKKRHPDAWRKYYDPLRARLSASATRARHLGMRADRISESDWAAILDYFGHRCAYCLSDAIPLEQDHVLALTKGGQHTVDNIVPACGRCNKRKGNRSLLLLMEAA
jgi:5-methylcytosine-specific restriction endonuclease McrA